MSIGEIITCERDGCDVEFAKRTHNMRYHDDECCRLATNAKIMQKYYARRAQKMGVARFCSQCEITKLSRYNSNNICNACELKSEIERTQTLSNMLKDVAWIAS